MSVMLEVEGLRYAPGGHRVLDVPSFAVEAGEVMAVIGPNGAGKSSLLQTLALLQPAHFDSYRWAGHEVRLPDEAFGLRRQMAVVFQEALLLDTTVYENVALGLKLRREREQTIRPRVTEALERLKISHLATRSVRGLSGGEAQRVSIARALVLKPRLLFLDEPFSALDVLTRATLLREMKQLLQGEGTTTLFVTHDFVEIPPLADRVAVILDGRVVQTSTPRELFTQPATPKIRDLVQVAHDLVRTLGGGEGAGGSPTIRE